MEQFQEIYTSLKSHAQVLPSDVVDKLTKNKALVRLLQDSELYHVRDFIVDYLGIQTNTSLSVTRYNLSKINALVQLC